MPENEQLLSQEMVNSPLKDGYYRDSKWFYLKIRNNGQYKNFCLRFPNPTTGKTNEFSIGNIKFFTLAEARKKADFWRKKIELGIDPTSLRKPKLEEDREAPFLTTFEEAALDWLEWKKVSWKNKETAEKQAISRWKTYVFPYISSKPICEIEMDEIVHLLKKDWTQKPSTLKKVQAEIEQIFSFAKAKNYIPKEKINPARWSEGLEYELPPINKLIEREKKNYYALASRSIPSAVRALKESNGMSALAVQFVLLTAARSMEVRGAEWEEINLMEKIWTIPKTRMKSGKTHVVPLSEEAISVLKETYAVNKGRGLIFGNKKGEVLSDVALSKAIKSASGNKKATIHGLRSTFADWSCELKAASWQAIQASLDHTFKTAADAAYFRSDLLNERRELLKIWGNFCFTGEKPEKNQVAWPSSLMRGSFKLP